MSRKVLGINIQDDAVTAVLVKSGISGNWIDAWTRVPILPQTESPETDENNQGLSPLAMSLKTIAEQIDTRGAVCAAAIPSDQISLRNLQVPFKDYKKIRQILPFELEPVLHCPVEETIIDYHPILLPNRTGETDIIVAAIETKHLKYYIDTLAEANFNPEIITLSGYTSALYLSRYAAIPENCLIIDIHGKKATISVIISCQLCLLRPLRLDTMPEKTVKSLCIDIQRTLFAFEEMFGFYFHPDEIYITGYGCENHTESGNFERDVEKTLGVSVKHPDITSETGTLVKKLPDDIAASSSNMESSFFLAMIQMDGIECINFRRGIFSVTSLWEEQRNHFFKTAALALIVIAAILINIMIDINAKENRAAETDEQIMQIFKTTFPDVEKIVDPLHQMETKLNELKNKTQFPGDMEKNIKVIDILNDMSSLIADNIDVEIVRLEISPESIIISGNTDIFKSVDEIKSQLEKSKFFKEVTISSTDRERTGDRIRFRMKVKL